MCYSLRLFYQDGEMLQIYAEGSNAADLKEVVARLQLVTSGAHTSTLSFTSPLVRLQASTGSPVAASSPTADSELRQFSLSHTLTLQLSNTNTVVNTTDY